MTAALLENFDLLAASVGGIARLRELILSLAVRGRLVPQDANDEPASELLKRIRAEKDRLIKEGKIKRDKPFDEITTDETPFEIPKSWTWARFGQASINRDGERIPVSAADREKRAKIYDYYGASGVIDKIDGYIFDQSLLLIGEDGANLLNRSTPIAFLAHGKYWVNNHAHVIDVTHAELMSYLCLFINAISLEPYITGTAQPKMNQAKLNSIVVALPPLAEQSRIVAKVEELMALCDRLEAEQGHAARVQGHWVDAALDQFAESADADQFRRHWQHLAAHFDTLFTTPESIDRLDATLLQLAVRGKLVPQDPNDEPASELLKHIRAEKNRLIKEGKIKRDKPLAPITDGEKPYELPKGWEWVRLEVIADIGTGTTPSRSTPEYWNPAEIPWVASGETGNSLISKTAESVSSLAVQQTSLRLYPVNTLVIALYGQGKTRGQISELLIEAATNQACAAIVPILSNADHKEYIKQYFRRIYDEIREEAAGGAQPNLNVGKIKSTLIPLPPLAEQSRIVAQVEKLLALTASLKTRLTAAQTKQAHLAEALIDEVV
ncbi:hypothetical protein CKCBHOJB_02306 [Thauera sp. GDN1]|uniref:restriction endonuclease subunit S n=1 Tax=Thauera sp. GDN1 TaxID=2944810 RepID=UPI0024784FA6|nr:restriction endonuclease subunit S [Thauera sp. GDN1]WEN42706.1 hypothetical protein CKCBHOJB_02306 [Thauera sp. GDN1]